MSSFQSTRLKLLQRHGDNGIRLVARTARALSDAEGCIASSDALREALREVGVWISDDDFADMVAKSCASSNVLDTNKFVKQLIGDLPSRRANVLQVLWERLDESRRGFVPLSLVFDQYDVSRHSDVVTGRTTSEDALRTFQNVFADCTESGVITQEELVAYYAGVSLRVERTEEFELLVARSFNLDRPKNFRQAANLERLDASQKSLQGRVHPLYQTSASIVGTRCNETSGERRFNRTGEFTKHAPPFVGATGLNTSTSRTRV